MKERSPSTEISRLEQVNSRCSNMERVSIIIYKKKIDRHKKRKRIKFLEHTKEQLIGIPSLRSRLKKNNGSLSKAFSLPVLKNRPKNYQLKIRSSDTMIHKRRLPFSFNYIVNVVSEYPVPECLNPFNNPLVQAKCRIYRCQLSTAQESCCCSCNSDAMFEVMKSLYDCYKKKNCDHCNCILCGHLPREERRLGEMRKSSVGIKTAGIKKHKKEKVEKAKKAAAIIAPLQGKSAAQKEKIIQKQAEMGLPLPEGRSASEKAIIQKVKATVPVKQRSKMSAAKIQEEKATAKAVSSEKLKKAQAAGVLSPLEGKTTEQKEKILRTMAMNGIPLPEGKPASENKFADKVRADFGFPPAPKTAAQKAKYQKAQAAGLIVPLEGKSPADKEKILTGQAQLGITLPEGRTASEKALIAKVKAAAKTPPPSKTPSVAAVTSEKLRKAKAAGLVTLLEGKTPEQKEKIVKGLVMQGKPLPEGKTASEKILIAKIKAEMPEKQKAVSRAVAGSPGLSEKARKLDAKTTKNIKEGKGPSDECICGLLTPEPEKMFPKPPSEKIKPGARVPSEKLRKVKATGRVTPLEGKTPEQKKKILKGLVKQGIPLPEGKTASEKKLIEKVRAEMGLPPEPKTPTLREKYNKAQAAGLITPLDGKPPAQKERILKAQAEMEIPLPEGRTPSEKALIAKIKAAVPPPAARAMSEKLRKAKASGFLTPLEGKLPDQKEKIFRGLVKQGIPLPEGKTASEKKLIDKIRAELGLPPEPKAQSIKDKYARAQAAGIVTPLEGKTSAQKEKILRAQAEMGIPLPEGRTLSEKALINKINATAPPPAARALSEKLRRAKATGLFTPVEGKTPNQKEKIFRGLIKQGLPLPGGKTGSDKQLLDKIRVDLGLPPEPKTPSMKDKYAKGQTAGIITPLEGKSSAQKEKILKMQADLGIPLPEGRTPSEKALISKIKAEAATSLLRKAPSEKLRKAKAAGLVTPPEGKTPTQKEKALRDLLRQELPLPEPKTPSDKVLMEKLRSEAARPSKVLSIKLKEAKAGGLLTPLEGKTPEQKEKILKGLIKARLPLPEGKSPSDKGLIRKVRDEFGLPPEPKTSSVKEKYRKAQVAGIISPLEGKTPAQKDKILKKIHEAGIPLPEGRTPSEKSMMRKIRAETPAAKAPPKSKEKIHKAKIASEKALEMKAKPSKPSPPMPLSAHAMKLDAKTAKVMKEGKGPSDECICGILTPESDRFGPSAKAVSKLPSGKLKKVKGEGLLTPLEGKTPTQKEQILKGLAAQGLLLPEGRTTSEKKLVDKVRTELGLPPEPKTASEKAKYNKALAAKVILPLEGKTPVEKEKTLRAQANMGIPLPEGRTPSEKALIAKVKSEVGAPSEKRVPSEKMHKAKATGLGTPLEGKSKAQKEKILRGLAEAGLPLPEGKTASEKSLIHKVKTELGIPPEAKTPSEKEVVRKAKAEGLLTPLAGKPTTKKEKIIKGLAEAGLPMPEGKTASEKAMIKKIRTAAGLPPESTPSEKAGKIKNKSKKVGAAVLKKSAKAIAAGAKSKAGVVEEFQDILKTTTCDRGCGCDKKKIRFKHSYVKIRVTSPDISSLCPCPNECIPGVKGGVFVDNEGIKVTVGSAIGVPSFSTDKEYASNNYNVSYINESFPFTESSDNITHSDEKNTSELSINDYNIHIIHKRDSLSTNSLQSLNIHNDFNNRHDDTNNICKSKRNKNTEISAESSASYLLMCSEIYRTPFSGSLNYLNQKAHNVISKSSFDSILHNKTVSSLTFSTECNSSIETINVISFHSSSIISTSSHYLCYTQSSNGNINTEDSEYFTKEIDYNAIISMASEEYYEYQHSISNYNDKPTKKNTNENEVLIFRMSQVNSSIKPGNRRRPTHYTNHKQKPMVVIDDSNSDHDVLYQMIDELLAKREFDDKSSIFIIVPTSDEYDSSASESASSTICIRLSENYFRDSALQKRGFSRTPGFKFMAKGKNMPTDQVPNVPRERCHQPEWQVTETIFERTKESKGCQVNSIMGQKVYRVVSMDTTQDRPCCCPPKMLESPVSSNEDNVIISAKTRCLDNVFSEIVTPMMTTQGVAQGLSQEAYLGVTGAYAKCQNPFVSPKVTTRISRCNVPPCTGYQGCHPSIIRTVNQDQQYSNHCTLNVNTTRPPCSCVPMKSTCMNSAGTDAHVKATASVGCGSSTCKGNLQNGNNLAERPPPQAGCLTPILHVNKGLADDMPCLACGRPTMKGGKKIACMCTGKEKKVQLPDECPCGQQRPLVPLDLLPQGAAPLAVPGQTINAQSSASSQDTEEKKETEKPKSRPCACDSKRRCKKNVICECPLVEEPPEIILIDPREERKLKSDQTQTASGFNLKIKKKPIEEELSFEDALMYYKQFIEAESFGNDGRCDCKGKGRPRKKDMDCDCPLSPELPPPLEPAEPELKGLKITIGAKGSGTKGLSGVCCFDLLTE